MDYQRIFQFIRERRSFFTCLVIFVAIGGICIGRLYDKKSSHTVENFVDAEICFARLQKDLTPLQELQTILSAHQELQPRYDGAIALLLISQDKWDVAQPFAERLLQRTHSFSQEHGQFGYDTLLIGKQDFQKALEDSLHLRDHLAQLSIEERSNMALLEQNNLFRIAMLYQVLGQRDEEKQSWKELLNASSSQTTLLTCVQENSLALSDYVHARIAELTN